MGKVNLNPRGRIPSSAQEGEVNSTVESGFPHQTVETKTVENEVIQFIEEAECHRKIFAQLWAFPAGNCEIGLLREIGFLWVLSSEVEKILQIFFLESRFRPKG